MCIIIVCFFWQRLHTCSNMVTWSRMLKLIAECDSDGLLNLLRNYSYWLQLVCATKTRGRGAQIVVQELFYWHYVSLTLKEQICLLRTIMPWRTFSCLWKSNRTNVSTINLDLPLTILIFVSLYLYTSNNSYWNVSDCDKNHVSIWGNSGPMVLHNAYH